MSLNSLRLLNTFCWHSFGAWGDRMLLLIFVFLSSQLQKMSEILPPPPISLFTGGWGLGPSYPFFFSFCGSSWSSLQGSPRVPLPLPVAQPAHTYAIPTVSTAKCDAFDFFGFCIVFASLFWVFPFLLRLCPEKQVVHVPCCFFTPSYVSPSPLFSIVCAKTDWFKGVSKKMF